MKRSAVILLGLAALLAGGCGDSETPAKDGKPASAATSTPDKQPAPSGY